MAAAGSKGPRGMNEVILVYSFGLGCLIAGKYSASRSLASRATISITLHEMIHINLHTLLNGTPLKVESLMAGWITPRTKQS